MKITYVPLFSVLIANCNNGKYLMDAIESVRAQTYTQWEIIIVDDGSTDNSRELYKQLEQDSRIHIFYNEENKGCGFTKRRCAELAYGELCGFLDPDDKLVPEALEVMVKEHEARPECSLIYSTHYSWDDLADTLVIQDLVGPMQNGEDFLVSSRNCVSHFSVFKKEAYAKTEGINQTLRSAIDVDMYFALEEVGDLFYINKPLYYYRQTNPNSISIGNDQVSSKAYANRIESSLNAFSRRIKSRSPLFLKNKKRYLFTMRWQMGTFKRNTKGVTRQLLNYCWWYLVASRFSPQSFNHVRKLL